MSLGNHLFRARKARGLSQEEVAEKLGVSRQTVSKWETDETLPDIRQSKRLAVLYGTSLDELAEFDIDVKEIQDVIDRTSEEAAMGAGQKDLSEMTLQELWERFPIFLVAHDDRWERYYEEIETLLKGVLAGYPVERISHIGSTAIAGIWAKDIVDVLVEVSKDSDIEKVAELIEKNGFIRMSAETDRISFNRGYTKEGFAEKVFHVHLRYAGDNDELYFRDYLNENPPIAQEYEKMKLQLWKRFERDRDAYTNAKTEFIKKWTSAAKRVYRGRYG